MATECTIPTEDRIIARTHSGDWYSGTIADWQQYANAVTQCDWDVVMDFEAGFNKSFKYEPKVIF